MVKKYVKSKGRERARCFCFTWNNYTKEEFENLKKFAEENCKQINGYTIQEEVGKNGTPHLQGFLNFKNPKDFKVLKELFPIPHWEITNNKDAAQRYCRKENSRNGEIFTNSSRILIDPLEGMVLYAWQQEVISLFNSKPDDRSIHWYYDLEGNKGKTSLAKHLRINHPNEVIYTTGKPADVKHGITQFLDNFDNDLKLVIFDYPRTLQTGISYEAIESVKNGIFYTTKYESKGIEFNPPHVIIFANFEPKYNMLSADRWKVKNISNKDSNTE